MDSRDYVRGRLSAGGIAEDFFTDDALEQIFAHSEGIPRRINSIASQLLLEARLSNLDKVDGALVDQLADSHDL